MVQAAAADLVFRVELDDEARTVGVGISVGGEAACFVIEEHLSRFVENQDPANV